MTGLIFDHSQEVQTVCIAGIESQYLQVEFLCFHQAPCLMMSEGYLQQCLNVSIWP
jgi:hypothetical protein